MREESVSINGVLYDAKTGRPIKKTAPRKPVAKTTPKKVLVRQPKQIIVKQAAKPIKRRTTSSRTLNRQIVKKPTPINRVTAKNTIPKVAQPITPARVARPMPSRIARRGIKRPQPKVALQASPAPTAQTPKFKKNSKKKKIVSIIISVCVLLAMAGTVLAYFFLPSVSVWVASQRADVKAVLPVYTPPGYKVSGTAESSLGIVTINYHSDALSNGYSLTQANSNWDSAGVLENKVKPLGSNHQTLSQKGLTIYRYLTGAIWVNGGVLYTITDEGKLSNEQILLIVDSI